MSHNKNQSVSLTLKNNKHPNPMTDPIEARVASTILQTPRELIIGGRTLLVAPPTTATLILASEAIATLPQVILDSEHVVEETLRIARDCRAIGEILAILILGARGLTETKMTTKKNLFGLLSSTSTETIDLKEELAQHLLLHLSPAEMFRLLTELIRDLQLADFFGITTFLIGVNLLRPTREVETETTVSGQSSEA